MITVKYGTDLINVIQRVLFFGFRQMVSSFYVPCLRILQEDTEGILDMMSMRAGEPLAGGACTSDWSCYLEWKSQLAFLF